MKADFYPEKIVEFYANLSATGNDENLIVITTVNRIEFSFNEKNLADWFGLTASRICHFSYDSWPHLFTNIVGSCHSKLYLGKIC